MEAALQLQIDSTASSLRAELHRGLRVQTFAFLAANSVMLAIAVSISELL